MKYWFLVLIVIFLFGCTSKSALQSAPQRDNIQADTAAEEPIASEPAVNLPDLGEAPELTNEVWLNVEQPLRLADLRGQVVLLDMWTFG